MDRGRITYTSSRLCVDLCVVFHSISGLCRQEREVFQPVWSRAEDSQNVLNNAYLLCEEGKTSDRKGRKVSGFDAVSEGVSGGRTAGRSEICSKILDLEVGYLFGCAYARSFFFFLSFVVSIWLLSCFILLSRFLRFFFEEFRVRPSRLRFVRFGVCFAPTSPFEADLPSKSSVETARNERTKHQIIIRGPFYPLNPASVYM